MIKAETRVNWQRDAEDHEAQISGIERGVHGALNGRARYQAPGHLCGTNAPLTKDVVA